MPRMTARPTRRSKAEMEKEFSQIAQEVETQKKSASPKAEEAARASEEEIRQAVEGLTVESTVQKLSNLGLEISKALSGLAEKMVAEVERLRAAREAVALETRELERIHKIDVAATALDQLIQDYRTQKEQLEAEISRRRQAWEEELARLRKEVEEFPARLKKEIDAASAQAAKLAEQRLEHQTVLLKKDAESEKRLLELRIKILEELVDRQAREIEGLKQQFEESKRQVQEIAVKAIEGASGAQALSHVNKIAMEQAKTRLPQS